MSALAQIRTEAAQRFAELGFPTTHDEEWRFTNVAPIAKARFRDAPEGANGWKQPPLAFDAIRLVFVNGRYSEGLSTRRIPAGITALPLRAANGAAERHLARHADYRRQPFVAFNTARFEDGAYVEVPDGVILSEPIHLLFLSTGAEQPVVTHPRSLVVVGAGSQATVVESYFGKESRYFTNAVTEIVAGDRAVVDHYKVQQEEAHAYHVATVQADVGRDASFSTLSVSLGGLLARNDINAVLSEGSNALMNGLYLVDGKQHADHHTVVDHTKPNGSSRELYKGILDDHSSAVFNGRIVVREDAQKTDSKQSNKNLILCEDATVNTKPELQIFADDVRCTHGATVGQLDEEAIFYLQSRGIGADEARSLLTQAFAREVLDGIKIDGLRTQLEEFVSERLQ